MLRFNIITYFSYVVIPKFQYILCYGSTISPFIPSKLLSIFQYILCYGSTLPFLDKRLFKKYYFNTSYVTVQQVFWSWFYFYSKISIHPMLRFNNMLGVFHAMSWNFNTSYVTVQLQALLLLINHLPNFNTSYVTVQPFSARKK